MSSYQALARRWRPRHFAAMSGQSHVLQALINALEQQRLHHAYLFSGTRGVGKTTIARILAKCLNCEKGIVAEPCGQCSACQEIDAGCFVDLIEVDAASRTKVEDTRELLDNVQYLPTRGRFKIYLIDEVHMLSNHSFNALLKTLEEPPEHVKFLLATTDPQKLPVTVLSRCLQFHLKSLSSSSIEKYLAQVLQKESIAAEPAALSQLAQSAKGSMRDALSLLDQAIAFGGGRVKTDDVCAMLGTVDQRYLHDLMQSLLAKDGGQLLSVIQQLADQAADFYQLLDDLLSLLHHLALAQTVNAYSPEQLVNLDPQLFSRETIQLYYQIALVGKRDLAYATTPQVGFEMLMLRMLAFELKTGSKTPSATTGGNIRSPKPAAAVKLDQAVTAPSQPQVSMAAVETSADHRWAGMLARTNVSGLTKALASHCTLKQADEKSIALLLSPQHVALLNDNSQQRLTEALKQQFGSSISVKIDIEKSDNMTPAQLQQQQQTEREAKAYRDIEADEQVQNLVDTFGAAVQQVEVVTDNK